MRTGARRRAAGQPGHPDEPTRGAIRRYLGEFLSDPRVIEIPRYLWMPILHGLVLTMRPKKLAPRYAGIWMEEGSPLLVYSQRQAAGVRQGLAARGVHAEVELAMRYGKPSIPAAITACASAAAITSWPCRCTRNTRPAPRPRWSMP